MSRRTLAQRVNAERLVLLGWPRAILMQVAHPLIAAGVAQHSTFRDTTLAPVQRLHATVRAMLALTFGTEDERARAIAGIRAIHTRVHGHLHEPVGRFPAGTPYSADDPALLLWVHATLVDTSVMLYDTLVTPLSEDERDAYCAESAPIAIALGAGAHAVPRDWKEMRAYVGRVIASGDLAVGTDGHALARALLHSPAVRATGPASWATRQLTIGWLPPTLRREYRLTWDARRERRAQRLVRLLHAVRPWTPAAIAHWRSSRTRG